MADTIDIDDITKALQEIAARSSKEVVDRIHKGIDRISRETLRKVKEDSPVYEGNNKNLKNGEYQKSWITSTLNRNGTHRKTIHNKKYQLVHLLELGHDLLDSDGNKYGYSPPKNHVDAAQEYAEKEVDALLEGL